MRSSKDMQCSAVTTVLNSRGYNYRMCAPLILLLLTLPRHATHTWHPPKQASPPPPFRYNLTLQRGDACIHGLRLRSSVHP